MKIRMSYLSFVKQFEDVALALESSALFIHPDTGMFGAGRGRALPQDWVSLSHPPCRQADPKIGYELVM